MFPATAKTMAREPMETKRHKPLIHNSLLQTQLRLGENGRGGGRKWPDPFRRAVSHYARGTRLFIASLAGLQQYLCIGRARLARSQMVARKEEVVANPLRSPEQTSLLKHRHLPLIFGGPVSRTSRGADYRQHRQRLQRRTRNEDTLRVRALVGRIDQKTLRRCLSQVGGHESFEDFVILKAQPHPQTFGT